MPGQLRQPAPSPATDDMKTLARQAILAAQAANGGGSADDPPIYFGRSHGSAGFDTELGARGSQQQKVTEVTKPFSAYMTDFYKLSKDALSQFQARAYQAGLYGNQKPRYGDPNDDVALSIWQDIGKRAAGFTAAGQKFTPGDVLDMAVQSAPADERQARAYQTRVDVVRSQDPDTIRAAAHAAFKEITGKGRRVDDAKITKFVNAFTAAQIAPQRKVNAAQDTAERGARDRQAVADAGGTPTDSPLSTEVRISEPDLGSSAEAFARSSDPAAAGAHAITKQFDSLLKMLGGVI